MPREATDIEGRAGVIRERNMTFSEWVAEYEDDLTRRPWMKGDA